MIDIRLLFVVAVVFLAYVKSMQGVTSSADGSMVALVRSIAKRFTLKIDKDIHLTKHIDYSEKDGHYYSKYPPGAAFAAVPFYLLGLNPSLVSVLAGTGSTVLLYLLMMHLNISQNIAFVTALIFAFCTVNWRYSTLIFPHALSAFSVLLAVYLYFIGANQLLVGVILGLSVMVEYTNVFFLVGLGLPLLFIGNIFLIPYLLLGFALGLIPLLVYNMTCFGSPFKTSYSYSGNFPWERSLKTMFSGNPAKGAFGLLFHTTRGGGFIVGAGLLTMTPVLLLSLPGFFELSPNLAIIFAMLFLSLFIPLTFHKTWWGGDQQDYRYLLAAIPYLIIPMALILPQWHTLIVFILVIVSLVMVIARFLAITVTRDDYEQLNNKIMPILRLIVSGIFVRKVHRSWAEGDAEC